MAQVSGSRKSPERQRSSTERQRSFTESPKARGIRKGYRSGLEESVSDDLKEAGIDAEYETVVIRYEKPAQMHQYTIDFLLPNDIIIETKGRFTSDDRKKHLLIKEQYPELDIRFVFSNPNTKINKRSKTTYKDWCEKHGFLYAAKKIPDEWLREPPKRRSVRQLIEQFRKA